MKDVEAALRAIPAVTRLTVYRGLQVGGSVIGGPLGIKTFYWFDAGFSGITFFPTVVFNELEIFFRLDMYLGACKSRAPGYRFEAPILGRKEFQFCGFLKTHFLNMHQLYEPSPRKPG